MTRLLPAALAASLLLGCSSEGQGNALFTTRGDARLEEGIPAGEGGLVDGWSVKYSKFLVVLGGVTLADASGQQAAVMRTSRLVDQAATGPKTLVVFPALVAQAYERVSYEIQAATAQTEILSGTTADRDFMARNGYALYIEGSATRGGLTRVFKWGFTRPVRYSRCRLAQTEGIVVASGSSDTTEITVSGSPFFRDRLRDDPTGAAPTSLRFEAIARADDDGDKDSEVTLDELARAPLAAGYDAAGLPASNLREFIEQLALSVGRFRGTGECAVE